MQPCPSDEQVFAFVENRLQASERAVLEAHLGDCAPCGSLVAAVAKGYFEARPARAGETRKPDFEPGEEVGPYAVVALAGRGGMGDVYRARDPRLGRDVAIKTLPQRFTDDPERLARFRLESRAAGSIAHANAVTVFDVGAHRGIPYLVTEWLTGKTLEERLAQGKLTAAETCRLGAQLARALGAAHDKGIIHRDLKPANVFLCADGSPKILDFGVARLLEAWSELPHESPTTPGALIGTVGYMSPEQIRGEEVDARSDVFALGAVLYEMVTGQRAFPGEGAIERMTAALRDHPPPYGGELGAVLARCLAKAPSDRFQSAHDLAFHLEALAARSAPPPPPRTARRVRWPFAAALLAAVAASAGLGYDTGHRASARASASRPTYRPVTFGRGQVLSARYASDGHTLVYSASWDGGPAQLYTARTELPGAKPLGAFADVRAISSRGELALLLDPQFFESGTPSGTLARMRIGSGAPRPVLEHVYEADWAPGGDALAAVAKSESRYRIEYPLGTVRYEGVAWPSHLRISPRGDKMAYALHPDPKDDMGTVALLEGSGPPRELSSYRWTSIRGLAWSPSGDEIWFTASDSDGFGLNAIDERGHVRLIDRMAGRLLLQDVSAEGQVLVDHAERRTGLYVGGREGERDLTQSSEGSYLSGLSSDGSMMIYSDEDPSEGPDYGAYLRRTDGSPPVRLGEGVAVALSHDGLWAAIRRFGPPQSLALVPTGAGRSRQLPLGRLDTIFDGRFFPDGRRLLLRGVESGPDHLPRLWVHDLGDGGPEPITAEGVAPISAIVKTGDRFAGVDAHGHLRLFGIHGEDLGQVPGSFVDRIVIGFDEDGSGLYLRTRSVPLQIVRVTIATGTVTPHLTLPAGGARPGLSSIMTLFLSADGRSYAYCTSETLSHLYIVDGLK